MISVSALLDHYFPTHREVSWQRALLRRLLCEHDLQQFASHYPHLQGLDFVEQLLSYFDFACDVAEPDLEHITTQL